MSDLARAQESVRSGVLVWLLRPGAGYLVFKALALRETNAGNSVVDLRASCVYMCICTVACV